MFNSQKSCYKCLINNIVDKFVCGLIISKLMAISNLCVSQLLKDELMICLESIGLKSKFINNVIDKR